MLIDDQFGGLRLRHPDAAVLQQLPAKQKCVFPRPRNTVATYLSAGSFAE
jgi:hypothetical protein